MNKQFNNEGLLFNVPPAKRFILFICITILCMIVGGIAAGMVIYFGKSEASLRIGTVVQDLMIFIVPAIVTAVIVTRQPADFLCLRKSPAIASLLIVLFIAIVSIPAMNSLISLNESLSLPESLKPLEEWMRQMEESAKEATDSLIGAPGPGGLLMAIIIVGVLAGFSEELFFRGCMQRIFATSGMNIHLAVWLTAVIFSAVHLQFFGFFPRLLLGAYFGYLLVWSRSIWLPMVAHALNNTLAVVAYRLDKSSDIDLDSFATGGSSTDIMLVIGSIIVTAALIVAVRKSTRRVNQISCE